MPKSTKKRIEEPRTEVMCVIGDYRVEGDPGRSATPSRQIEEAVEHRLKSLQETFPYDVVRVRHQSLTHSINTVNGEKWLTAIALFTFEW
jgi:hypothetical protein